MLGFVPNTLNLASRKQKGRFFEKSVLVAEVSNRWRHKEEYLGFRDNESNSIRCQRCNFPEASKGISELAFRPASVEKRRQTNVADWDMVIGFLSKHPRLQFCQQHIFSVDVCGREWIKLEV